MEKVIRDWVIEFGVVEASLPIRLAEVYEWYKEWALESSRPLCGIKKFGKILAAEGFVREQRHPGTAWIYIGKR